VTPITLADPFSDLTAVAGGACEQGNHRENNEDYLLIEPDPPLCLVLDGMGGHAAGELASRTGGDAIYAALRRGLATDADPQVVIERAVRQGHRRVRDLGRSDRNVRGCGSTVVLALLHRGRVFVTWLGDSMAYRVSADRVERLTRPHDLRHALIDAGVIPESHDGCVRNVIWLYLGDVELPEALTIPCFVPRPGDRVILSTDGTWGVLEDSDLLAACREYAQPQACAEHLVRLALDRGSHDNCTCAVIAFPGDPDSSPTATPPPRKWWQLWR
jgi:protein phosphatase